MRTVSAARTDIRRGQNPLADYRKRVARFAAFMDQFGVKHPWSTGAPRGKEGKPNVARTAPQSKPATASNPTTSVVFQSEGETLELERREVEVMVHESCCAIPIVREEIERRRK